MRSLLTGVRCWTKTLDAIAGQVLSPPALPSRAIRGPAFGRQGIGHGDCFLCVAMGALWLDENRAGRVGARRGTT